MMVTRRGVGYYCESESFPWYQVVQPVGIPAGNLAPYHKVCRLPNATSQCMWYAARAIACCLPHACYPITLQVHADIGHDFGCINLVA